MKLPLLHNRRYTPPKSTLGIRHRRTSSDGCESTASLRSTNTALASMLRVSHVESLVLALWLSQVTQWFFGEPLETSRTWCDLKPNLHS
jgi:hypothetical protein